MVCGTLGFGAPPARRAPMPQISDVEFFDVPSSVIFHRVFKNLCRVRSVQTQFVLVLRPFRIDYKYQWESDVRHDTTGEHVSVAT